MKQLIECSKMSNGSLLITEEIQHLSSSVFGIFVRIGSDYETVNQNGISHIIEHMLFKGTKLRDAKKIALEIESLGGVINAYTSRDHTSYYFICLPDVLSKILSIFQDMMFNSLIPNDQLEREKKVILEELHSAMDDPQDIVFQNLNKMMYQDTPYEKSILGTEKTIRSITRNDIINFMNKYYSNSNIFLSSAGPSSHEEVRKIINFKNVNIKSSKIIRRKRVPVQKGLFKYVYKPTLSQLHVAMGTKGVKFESDEKYSLLLLSAIIGSGMSSRLFRILREDMGIVYEIYSFLESFFDSGIFGLYFICDAKNFEKAMKAIKSELKNIIDNGINDEEIQKVKTQIISSSLISFDTLSGRMRFLARSMLYHEKITYLDESIEKIRSIDKDQLMRTAKKYCNFKDFNISIIGSKRKFEWKP